jgi:hypothetical protein
MKKLELAKSCLLVQMEKNKGEVVAFSVALESARVASLI